MTLLDDAVKTANIAAEKLTDIAGDATVTVIEKLSDAATSVAEKLQDAKKATRAARNRRTARAKTRATT
ncbi:hypothetical protein, partial [Bifidobacterium crudilactis]|uniref:hypothetical protein n=1 Tax=Bifidobacterium crudilactis TaxID=327277 RepID=UPI00264A3511